DGEEIAVPAAEWIGAWRWSSAQERCDVGGLHAAALQLGGEARVEDELERVVLVVGLAPSSPTSFGLRPVGDAQLARARHDALGRVRQRGVAQVVKQHGQAQGLAEAVAVGATQLQLGS